MDYFSLAQYKWQTKLLWSVMSCLSVVALGFAVYEISSYSLSQYLVLAVTLFISSLINQHLVKIPGKNTEFSAKEFVVFWGTIWLGTAGGVLLAASASLARLKNREKDYPHRFLSAFTNIFAAFVAGQIFYLFIQPETGFAGNSAAAANSPDIFYFLIAVGFLAVTHYLINISVYSIYFKFEGDSSVAELWNENFVWSVVVYLLGTAATLLLHFSFVHFGIEFGLVLLPVAVIGHLSHRIHNRRLEQKTREITEASRIHLATVEALATAIDARDQVGIGHVRRAQIYAIGIGKILNLPESQINALETGALLHDIGKLAVPDHILNKPGRLTPAEMEKTKIHSSVGASILEKVGFRDPVVPTVKYHHECWDGSGYPEGLKGETIPLTARILSVADSYDTLRGARPYRAAVSRGEARKYLLRGAGKQFDPQIVGVFLRNLRKFEAEVDAQGLSYNFDAEDKGENLYISENKTNQSYVEQIKRANREVFTLYELARVFSASLNLQDTLSLFTQKIGEFVPFDTCAVYLLDETQENAVVVYVEGRNSAALKNKRIKIGEGATGYVLKKRQSVQNINPGLDFSFSELELVQDYASMVSLPLITDEKLLGAVSLYSCELDSYEEEHLRLLETVSRIASDTIGKSLQHAETETRALTDPMTGLPNARSLQTQFEKEAARAERKGGVFQVLMLDLDGFKAVNDTFGHKVGDMLLKGVARAMRDELRDYDFIARYAGDEFVAIIPETDAASVRELCHRLERAVSGFRLQVSDEHFASVGVSLGAASYPHAGMTFDQLVAAADKAMYEVKSKRKGQTENRERALTETHQPAPLPIREVPEKDLVPELPEENFAEPDESHVISSAIN